MYFYESAAVSQNICETCISYCENWVKYMYLENIGKGISDIKGCLDNSYHHARSFVKNLNFPTHLS